MIEESELQFLLASDVAVSVTIDGPSGSGKGTLATLVSARFGLQNVSMGNLFRALFCFLRDKETAPDSTAQIVRYLETTELTFEGAPGARQQVFNGIAESAQMKTSEVARGASVLAANTEVHQAMTRLVRKKLANERVVMEGRAIGSSVFPTADIKFYLHADIESRVARTMKREPEQRDHVQALREKIIERDTLDQSRTHAPLVRTDSHVFIDSSKLSIEETFALVSEHVCQALTKKWFQQQFDKAADSVDSASRYQVIDALHAYCTHFSHGGMRGIDASVGTGNIGLEFYNMLGARLATSHQERPAWEALLGAVPSLLASASSKEFFVFEHFLTATEDAAKGHVIADLEKLIRGSTDVQDSLLKAAGPYQTDDVCPELVLLIKPPISSDAGATANIVERLYSHGWRVELARVLNGAYFRAHPHKVTTFYQEAAEGFREGPVPGSLSSKLRERYNVPEFEFFFGEPYSDDLVFPAETLLKRCGVDVQIIADLWESGRRDIAADEFKARFSLDEVVPGADAIRLRKAGRTITIPRMDGSAGSAEWHWYNANQCFSLNKVSRARSAFAVRHPKIREGRTTIVLNGHLLGLMQLFSDPPQTLTIALAISRGPRSSSLEFLSRYFKGSSNNPAQCMEGSVRKDAASGRLKCSFEHGDDRFLNGLKNLVHLSSGPLEGVAELTNLFDLEIQRTRFGRMLLEHRCGKQQIDSMLQNLLQDETGRRLFELTSNREPEDALHYVSGVCKAASAGKALGTNRPPVQ